MVFRMPSSTFFLNQFCWYWISTWLYIYFSFSVAIHLKALGSSASAAPVHVLFCLT